MTKGSNDSSSYAVGYGKPPKHTQFKKGKSGNPKGRSKGAKGLATALRTAASKPIIVQEGGKRRKVSMMEAGVMALITKALKGNDRAMATFLALAERMVTDAPAEKERPFGEAELSVLKSHTKLLKMLKSAKP